MAIQETRTLPAPFIETLGEDYAKQLTRLTADPIDTSKFAPQVAAQDVLQTQAATQAAAGIGAFQPFVTEAQRLAGMDPTTQQVTAAGITAAQTPFMSPFQQQVIDTTLAEFDRQRGMREQQIGDAAVRAGAFGGARQGLLESDFMAQSDQDRAALQAQLQQTGFQQAEAARQQAIANQLGFAQGLPALQAQEIGLLGQVGATQQAQTQAVLDAQREAERAAAFEPYERLGFFGSGVTGLMGGYPAQFQFSSIPNPTPLQTALGTGATLAGIYGAIKSPGALQSIPMPRQF